MWSCPKVPSGLKYPMILSIWDTTPCEAFSLHCQVVLSLISAPDIFGYFLKPILSFGWHMIFFQIHWSYTLRGQFEVINVFGNFLFIYILGQSYCSTYSWDILCFQAIRSVQTVFHKYFSPYRSSCSNSRLISYGMAEWCYYKSNVWKSICTRPWLLFKWPLILRCLALGNFIHSDKRESAAAD